MVQLVAPPGAGEVIPLRRQPELSQACLADVAELAEFLFVTPEQALELATSVVLRQVHQGLAYFLRPPAGPAADHKRGSDGA